MPPGVRVLDAPPAARDIPVGVAVAAIEVDWTHPLLRARVVKADMSGGLPERWGKIAPDALKIQLIEPTREGADAARAGGDAGGEGDDRDRKADKRQSNRKRESEKRESENNKPKNSQTRDDAHWRMPLACEIPPPPDDLRPSRSDRRVRINPEAPPTASPGRPARDCARVGGLAPFFYTGPTARADESFIEPEAAGSTRVDVRWLGHPADWQTRPPDLEFKDSLLLASSDPESGKSTFLLVYNSTAEALPASFLGDWLELALPPDAWLALHSVGREARVGLKDWRLGEIGSDQRGPTEGKSELLGAALVLDELAPGGQVDWARMGGVATRASSTEVFHAPENVASGRSWPAPLSPNALWSGGAGREVGGAGGAEESGPWIELRLREARPVRELRLLFAGAAGWSPQFNPRRALLTIERDGDSGGADGRPIELKDFPAGRATLRWPVEERIKAIRLSFPEPAGQNAPGAPARLQAVQMWGAWSGERPAAWEGGPVEPAR